MWAHKNTRRRRSALIHLIDCPLDVVSRDWGSLDEPFSIRDRSNAMTDKRDIDRFARRAKHATKKLAHEVSDGATELVDDGRETVRIAFEKIKAARIGVEKKKGEKE